MKQLRSWHLSTLKVISEPMSALARTAERDCRTRTTNENCPANESWTRTKYLYDGANAVQEISGTAASANLLTGGVDEYFQRIDSAGARSFLTDALGSTLALADSSGALQTQYTFEPFGNSSVTGAATTNSFAYTGRELDNIGLYFYRARYYSPQFGRFISQDPVGFAGGINQYGYALNSPTNLIDPSGTEAGYQYQYGGYMYSPYDPGFQTVNPSYYTLAASIGPWSPNLVYVPSSNSLYSTPTGVGVPGTGFYLTAGFISNQNVNPDQYVYGPGGSACAFEGGGGCITFAPVNGSLEPSVEVGVGFGFKPLGPRNRGAGAGYTNTWNEIVWALKGFAGRGCGPDSANWGIYK
jgi:RHS repeat-associated protein